MSAEHEHDRQRGARPPWERPDPALYDEVTLLPNPSLLLDRLATALRRAYRSGRSLAIVRVAVDGHRWERATTDPARRTIAERLARAVRTCDTVARGDGDEYTLLCECLTAPEDIALVLDRVRASMRDPVEVAGTRHHVTVSMGAVITNDPMLPLDELLDEAARQLDAARRDGPGRSRTTDWSLLLLGEAAAALDDRRGPRT
jgi:diguanylate cyclase (GGDEF)-like protein